MIVVCGENLQIRDINETSNWVQMITCKTEQKGIKNLICNIKVRFFLPIVCLNKKKDLVKESTS